MGKLFKKKRDAKKALNQTCQQIADIQKQILTYAHGDFVGSLSLQMKEHSVHDTVISAIVPFTLFQGTYHYSNPAQRFLFNKYDKFNFRFVYQEIYKELTGGCYINHEQKLRSYEWFNPETEVSFAADGPNDNNIVVSAVWPINDSTPVSLFVDDVSSVKPSNNSKKKKSVSLKISKLRTIALCKKTNAVALATENSIHIYSDILQSTHDAFPDVIATQKSIVSLQFITPKLLWALDQEGAVFKLVNSDNNWHNKFQEKKLPQDIIAIGTNQWHPRMVLFACLNKKKEINLYAGDVIDAKYRLLKTIDCWLFSNDDSAEAIRNTNNFKLYCTAKDIILHEYNNNPPIGRKNHNDPWFRSFKWPYSVIGLKAIASSNSCTTNN